MKRADFREQRQAWTTERLKLCDTKGNEYTRGSDDQLANFKRLGEMVHQDPRVILGVYMQKHLDSIFHFIATGDGGCEGIRGRIDDAQNYLDLLRAMVEEATP